MQLRNEDAVTLVYRVEIEREGERFVWAVLASDFVAAARRAMEIADRPNDLVVSIQPVGELL
ncbi:MAG: hypothetical protein ACK4YP_13760 [Myxococcota bacterium]